MGEEAENYRNEFKALYFGVKNIITKEIQYSDKEIDISQFFDKEASAGLNIQQTNSVSLGKRGPAKNKSMISNFGGMSNSSQNQRQNHPKQKSMVASNPPQSLT